MDINNLFSTNIRINNIDPLDANAVWPNQIEVTICRIPIRKRDGYSPENLKKLAEKLKNAMYPQSGKGFLATDNGEDVAYVPTVEELIRACGQGKMKNKVVLEYIKGKKYKAGKNFGADGQIWAEGKTSLEALANLWLANNDMC